MPEMPEVETIARKLRKTVLGKAISAVYLSGLSLRRPVPDCFAQQLRGRTIRRIHRRGKYLIVEMYPRSFLLVHLGMTGRIFYQRGPGELEKHTQAVIRFIDRGELRYVDHRRFGLLAVYSVTRLGEIPELQHMGKDALSSSFRHDWLRPQLLKCRQEIKSFLLDQRKVAGLGNIYACEALFRARIHPARRCYTLTTDETRRLVRSVRSALLAGIRNRGTSFSDYLDSDGEKGDNQNFLRVFQRENENCTRCRTKIQRLRQGTRSSFFCPRCQPNPSPIANSREVHVHDDFLPKMPAL